MNHPGKDQPSPMFTGAVKAHRAGDLQQAQSLYRQVIQQEPRNAEAFHQLGLIAAGKNQLTQAVNLICQAVERDASNPDYRANLGSLLQAQGRLNEAIDQLQQAIRLQPKSWELHYNLANALQQNGQLDAAVHHYETVAQAKPDCVEALANLGVTRLRQHKHRAAVESLQRAIQLKPDSAAIRYSLARALHMQGQWDAAVAHYRQLIQQQPKLVDAYIDLARAFQDQGELNAAITTLRQALGQNPDDGKVLRLLSQLLRDNGEFETAVDCIRRIIQMTPQSAEAHFSLGLTLEDQGKLDEAQDCYHQSLQYKPTFTPALVAQAGILEKKGEIKRAYDIVAPIAQALDADVAATVLHAKLTRQLGRPKDAADRLEQMLRHSTLSHKWRIIAHTNLGQVYDELGQFDSAFAQFRQANNLKRGRFDADRHARFIADIIATFDRGQITRFQRAMNPKVIPVFVVGMPRSGTSLIEQILASHPRVYGAGELTDIDTMTETLPTTLGCVTPYPRCVGDLTQSVVDSLADRYLSRLHQLSPTAQFVTDKMPHNYLHVGFIRMLFPTAPIIHCVRDPWDTCLSCYFANFLASQTFANDLHSLAHYYTQYVKLMRHWAHTLDEPMFDVCYEELVREPKAICQRLLDDVGLEWDDRCLRFHHCDRFVNTASYQQVRQPLYTRSVGRWKNYEKFLGPLLHMTQ